MVLTFNVTSLQHVLESATAKLARPNGTLTLHHDHVDFERLTRTAYANVLTRSGHTCVIWFNGNQGERVLEHNELQRHYLMFPPVLTDETRK